jgi:O-antigen/teichoic acid export membrane protein
MREAVKTALLAPHAHPTPRALAARFLGYLSADGLNYALGFVIYSWLVRVLTNQQYGQLSIATTLYQALMMVAALGLDLTGPKLIAEFGTDPIEFARTAQGLRLRVALVVCGPIQLVSALVAWHRGQALLAVVILASFSMVLARALDLTYLAVALRVPSPLVKTRASGLSAYLVMLILCTPWVRQHLWLVPVLNAAGVTLGRIQLGRLLRKHAPAIQGGREIRAWEIVVQGTKAGGGQLLLLIMMTGDVILLAKYVGADALGQYAMISRLYLLAIVVPSAMFNIFMPEIVNVAHSAAKLRRQFRTYVRANLVLGVAGWACFHFLGARLCELITRRSLPDVRAIAPMFAVVFLLLTVANPFLSNLPVLHRGTEYLFGVGTAVFLLLGLDLFLIPRYGVLGAAYGQVVATGFLAIFSAVVFLLHMRTLTAANELASRSAAEAVSGVL